MRKLVLHKEEYDLEAISTEKQKEVVEILKKTADMLKDSIKDK